MASQNSVGPKACDSGHVKRKRPAGLQFPLAFAFIFSVRSHRLVIKHTIERLAGHIAI